jgi:hypothetical protein
MGSGLLRQLNGGEYKVILVLREIGNDLLPMLRTLRNMQILVYIILAFIFVVPAFSQPTAISGEVNSYTPVLGINPCDNTIGVLSADDFAVGDRVLIIQMRGARMDTSATASFGTITSQGDVGHYEFGTISSISGGFIGLRDDILSTYTIGGRVQLVRVPVYQSADVTGTLTAPAWNGQVGGVLAIDVADTLRLGADITMTGQGFRGGPSMGGERNCGTPDYFLPIPTFRAGGKGEGIVELSMAKFGAARGPLATGGGGGNDHNSGGAGGGNAGAGGHGGKEWSGCPSPIDNGGIGGNRIDYSGGLPRVIMGGGGGGGHHNDATGSPGTNGGGIIIIRARVLDGNGFPITANGAPSLIVANVDGAGGGGAGGAIVLDVDNVVSPVTVEASGAAGGDGDNQGLLHGPGGGGGGGMIVFAGTQIPSQATASAAGGRYGTIPNPNDFSYGATAGENGIITTGAPIPEGDVPHGILSATVELPLITANPGDTITIPLALLASKSALNRTRGYRAALRFNRHLLLPIGATPAGTIDGDDRVYTISGPSPDSAMNIAALRFIVLLGPSDTTSLIVESFAWDTASCAMDLEINNGMLTVNTCRTGDPRLVNSGPEALLRPIRPNPAGSILAIDYQLLEDGPTRLTLFDMDGHEVVRLLDTQAAPGSYSLRFDASPLADGTYLCLLQTPTGRFSQVVQIQR